MSSRYLAYAHLLNGSLLKYFEYYEKAIRTWVAFPDKRHYPITVYMVTTGM